MTVKRTIPANVEAVIDDVHTLPFFIVKAEIASGTQYWSETQEVTFEANVYIEAAIKVRSFNWGPEGTQVGAIAIMNDNNSASALVLNNVIQDVTISIYKVYSTGPTTNTDPVFMVKGVMSGVQITPKEVIVGVLTSSAQTEFAPRDFYTFEEGFSRLPPVGTVVTWGGEVYVLEGLETG